MPKDSDLFMVHIDEAYEKKFFINKTKPNKGCEPFFEDNKSKKEVKLKSAFGLIKLHLPSTIPGVKDVRTLVFGLKNTYKSVYEFNYELNNVEEDLFDFSMA